MTSPPQHVDRADSQAAPDLGAVLFSFVVVADTHVNEHDNDSSSPFLTNRKANARARFVFQQIGALKPTPQFGVHLGDMVHPLPSLPTFRESVSQYNALAALAGVPMHAVPGNHDVGDKCVDWMPAESVCDEFLTLYRSLFGRDYYSFDQHGVRFIVINSLLLNSSLEDEQKQRAWLEHEIAKAAGGRAFVFMHYPPFICSPEERSHYDNIDEPGRSWLLSLLRQPQVEGVFAGHVHNFWYDQVGSAEFYMLPSTAFVRHDYAEFQRVEVGAEFGRNDLGKFGYMKVDVHARGHVAYIVRTQGAESVDVSAADKSAPPSLLAHPKTSKLDRLGVELRHPWTETMQIAATGGVQEFNRKWARNDYPLLALLEMGARLSKVPDIDLAEPQSAHRMSLLARMGHRFIVTTLGAPKAARMAISPAAAGVCAFEVNATLADFKAKHEALRGLRNECAVEVYFAKIHAAEHGNFDGKQFSHQVISGFGTDELDTLDGVIGPLRDSGSLDGVTVRIEARESLIENAARLLAFCERLGVRALASMKMGSGSIATERADDRATVLRVAQAAVLSLSSDRILFVFDTFMDVDRGYCPRHAFIDRRFNARPPATAFAAINALTSSEGPLTIDSFTDGAAGTLTARSPEARYDLVWGLRSDMTRMIDTLTPQQELIDLVEGRRVHARTWLDTMTSAAEQLEVVLIRSV